MVTVPINPATNPRGPWAVGSGSEELNGTYDMMGNIWEWMESLWYSGDDWTGSARGLRGGSYLMYGSLGADYYLASSDRYDSRFPHNEAGSLGFRVASEVPEPLALSLMALGGLAALRRRKSKTN